MKRRNFLALLGAAMLALPLAMAPAASAAETVEYRPGLVKKRLAKGETLLLDFKAEWCSTCRAQERRIRELVNENPEYAQQITFVLVDWDTYKKADITKALRIPRRSTLVALKGDEELGRVVAKTGRRPIKALLDAALTAATK